MNFHPTDRFLDDYDRLAERLQERTDRALGFLLKNPRHPSLRTHKMGGQKDPKGRDIREAATARSGGADDHREDSVTEDYRFTFAIEKDAGTYILYRVGTHDVLRRPL